MFTLAVYDWSADEGSRVGVCEIVSLSASVIKLPILETLLVNMRIK